jgi:hypothetical protein
MAALIVADIVLLTLSEFSQLSATLTQDVVYFDLFV